MWEKEDTTMLIESRLSLTDQFVDDKGESGYRYLSGYERARSATDQFAEIRRHFPRAESYDAALAGKDPLAGTEGNFLILPWQKVASTYYNEAVEIVLGKLDQARGGKFYNYNGRQGQLGPDRLRESRKKAGAMRALASAQQGHDVLVLSAQLGLRHRGRSVRRARVVMRSNEFGLGAYEMGFILLTHPDRLAHWRDLYAHCAGDEYRFESWCEFLCAPCFDFRTGQLQFRAGGVGYCSDDGGSASAFVPSW